MSEEDINKSRFSIQNFVLAPSQKSSIEKKEKKKSRWNL